MLIMIRNHFPLYKIVTVIVIFALLFPAYTQVQAAGEDFILPVVAIHISELTQALDNLSDADTTATEVANGYPWNPSDWHYFVLYESIMEALRSDGTPFVTVSDADIRAGRLLLANGTPRYPIMISLAAEATSDDEAGHLRDYVAAGGFLFVGSSAFTLRPDGSPRGDFTLANEMGIHTASSSRDNWYINQQFTIVTNHLLVAQIPAGNLTWNMPLSADEVYWGTAYTGHHVQGAHYDFKVNATDATVIAKGERYPLLAVKNYGKGVFIYHADLQPLIGFGGNDAGMYAYSIYRDAIQWAFGSANLPLVRLSPWQYPYDAAFILRHDFENTSGQAIEASAKAEFDAGARGDYYFCTGVLREQLKNNPAIIASLRRAVTLYGATIGPHNGGLKNPNNPSLTYANFEYWHWGPDEALNGTPAGFDYALRSIAIAYQDIERWLAGTDNGRPGCGAAGNCPRIWVSPYFNSDREDSNIILDVMQVVSTGEQKISPFPHFTLSTRTEGLFYPQVSLPVSDWFIKGKVAQSIESGHTETSIENLVDAYYQMGALVNLYGHTSSASGLMNDYMRYSLSKPRMWAANSVSIADWWALRSKVTVTPTYRSDGVQFIASAVISGSNDADTTIELTIPRWAQGRVGHLQIFLNGAPAAGDRYRFTHDGIKVKVGSDITRVEVRYTTRADLLPSSWRYPHPR